MADGLLDGIRVVDLAGEPAAMAGCILADLGAEVVLVEPPDGAPLRAVPNRFTAWSRGKRTVTVSGADDPELDALLASADVVIDTPGFTNALVLDPARAPQAIWVSVTPFGLDGPRSAWRASDLGVMAAGGNMYSTGDPDRAPVRCTEPSGYGHTGPEVAFAALTALATGRPQRVDVSMQEVVLASNMVGVAQFRKTGERGTRRGANIGRTREIWPCRDGWVSYGLRGGKARVPSLQTLTRLVVEDGIDASALVDRDWNEFSHVTATDEDLAAIEAAVGAYFARHTMQALYDIACETNLMLAPCNSPKEIYASAQLAAREFFGADDERPRMPRKFVTVTPGRSAQTATAPSHAGRGAWEGTKILEFGSGAAGPIATRYFVEHGATVLRVESPSRPDFLRVYALSPDNPHGLEGAPMYDGLNVGKRNVTLNLKHPAAVDLARRLVVEWADAVLENYAPRAMRSFGLDYATLVELKPDLVMISACLNGQTGPHRNYPGFGSQGSALSGFNWLTGWPDREPVGPHATITDSLAPRFVSTALAAGLLHHRTTGEGVYLDVAQVEAGIYTNSAWLLDYEVGGVIGTRMGNRSSRAVPHGAFPCVGDDRWVAIACWTDDEWARLADVVGVDGAGLGSLAERQDRIDEVEAAVTEWTSLRTREEVVDTFQPLGIEAVPVLDFGDLNDDPQLAHRGHFVELTHPFMGEGRYERNGFRLSDADAGYDRSGPTLGQDNDWVLGKLLGLSPEEREKLAADGAFD